MCAVDTAFRLEADFGAYQSDISSVAEALAKELKFNERIWKKDATLWKKDAGGAENIRQRLGWLEAPAEMTQKISELESFVETEVRGRFTHVVLLGMGGSSLAPELFQRTFGAKSGLPALFVLDNTDPGAIEAVERAIDLKQTLFIVSSKSGSTIETHSFYLYFFAKVAAYAREAAGAQFVAITDPGSGLEKMAREKKFLRIFLAPPDVGGRFSALTYFGLVPAACIGVDLKTLLARTQHFVQQLRAEKNSAKSAPLLLGAAMGKLARAGRDKLTLIFPSALTSLGDWIEQLVAESTGKEMHGVLPVTNEPTLAADCYVADRFFIFFELEDTPSDAGAKVRDDMRKQLAGKRHPVARILLSDMFDIGIAFFLWEYATAVAASVLEINPFDEPNVTESKEITQKLLASYEHDGTLPSAEPSARAGEDDAALGKLLQAVLGKSQAPQYVALMYYGNPTKEVRGALAELQKKIAERFRVAVTLGFGPRFLHSTGQLHKGGPAHGLFLQFVEETEQALAVPGKSYTFEVLKLAQALGDFQALKHRGRSIARIALRKAAPQAIWHVTQIFEKAIVA